MDKFLIGMWIFLGLLITMIVGGVYYYGYLKSEDAKNELLSSPLERFSCEQIAWKKDFLNHIDVIGYDDAKIIKILDLKWNQMNCKDPSSPYWKGDHWTYVEPIEKRIEKYNEAKP